MRSDRIVLSSSARRAGPSPDSRASAVASASRWAVHSPKRCMSADSPSGKVLVDHISAWARSRSGTSSPLSSSSAIRSCSEATAPGTSWSSGASAMAEARASSNRPWSSSWSRAAAMSGQARGARPRRPLAPRSRKYRRVAVAGGLVEGPLGVEASSGEAADQLGHHEPWLAVAAPVELAAGARRGAPAAPSAGSPEVGPRSTTAAAASSRNGPANTDTWRSVALSRLRQQVDAPGSRAESTPRAAPGEGAGHRPPAAPRRRGPPRARWCREATGLPADAGDLGADVSASSRSTSTPPSAARAAKSTRAGWSAVASSGRERQRGQPDHALAARRGSAATRCIRTLAAG